MWYTQHCVCICCVSGLFIVLYGTLKSAHSSWQWHIYIIEILCDEFTSERQPVWLSVLQPVILSCKLAGLPPLHPSLTSWETKMDARSWLPARTDRPLSYWPYMNFNPSLHSQFVLLLLLIPFDNFSLQLYPPQSLHVSSSMLFSLYNTVLSPLHPSLPTSPPSSPPLFPPIVGSPVVSLAGSTSGWDDSNWGNGTSLKQD